VRLRENLYHLQVISSFSILALVSVTNSKSWSADEKDDKACDDLFTSHADNMGDYLNLEGPEEEMQDIGSSGHIEVTIQGGESKSSSVSLL